jgi:threonine aldolase
VCIENTTNKGGGACWEIEELKMIRAVCQKHHLAYHLDGARIWNALVAKDQTPAQFGQLFDTISVCLSKGLGCPVGSLLLGDRERINKALRIRKILGGGMRQAGYMAAAGVYALDNHINRLAEDHRKAMEVAAVLQHLPGIKKVEPVETNIIIFEVDNEYLGAAQFREHLLKRDIHIIEMGQGKLRMVTHLDYTDAMHGELLEVMASL